MALPRASCHDHARPTLIRGRKDSDEAALLEMYDGNVPTLVYERVLVEDGKIVGHAGIRMVPEVVLVLADDHPAAKVHRLRILQQELLRWMHETGYKRIIALVAPKIERSFLKRLATMGWREGYQSAVWLEDEDAGTH